MARRVPLNVLRELMGHSDIKTTLRYIDVSEDDKRRASASVFGSVARRGSGKRAAEWEAPK
jgi:site-specific recombinase XerD